jgi:hypothetical protein
MARPKAKNVDGTDFTTGRSRAGDGGASNATFDPNRPGLSPNNAGGRPSSFDSVSSGGRPSGAVPATPQSLEASVSPGGRAAGGALQKLWNFVRGGPKKPGNLVDGASSKGKPLAEAPKTKEDLVDAGLKDGPEADAALKHADDLAKEPSVSRTLQKWGVRGGVGVVFLMMLYDTANPFEAIARGAEDTKDTVKGAADVLSSIFEAFKGLLGFLTQNWMVSAASSCCCVLLMILPMIMGAGRAVAPRPRFGGPYY